MLRNDAGVLPFAAPARVAVVGPLADLVLTDWYAGTPPYAIGIGAALAERYPEVEIVTGADTVALRASSNGRHVVVSEDGATVEAVAPAAGEATWFDVTDWGDGILTLRSHASGRLLTGGAWPMRADADRVGGWVVQESFRRHVHADGTWSLLHLGSGRWLRVMRDSGLLAAEAVTLEAAERFGVRTIRSGHDSRRRGGGPRRCRRRRGRQRPAPRRAARPRIARTCSCRTRRSTLWRAAREANPRSVLTIVSSYPYVLGDGVADAETVVWSSHGGQELGHGIADVLSGDREPSGRLAQSWPATEAQAGDLFDYDTLRQGATYRHQPEAPRFAFGHGCTYGQRRVRVRRARGRRGAGPAGDAPARRVRARRAGPGGAGGGAGAQRRRSRGRRARAGVRACRARRCRSRRRSACSSAYRRVRLAPGASRDVEVEFPVARLAVWDDAVRLAGAPDDWLHAGALRVQPGGYTLASGPNAWDLPVPHRAAGHRATA